MHPPSGPRPRGSRWEIPITASSTASAPVIPTITSTSETRCWVSLCVGSFLPFQTTDYLNGHHYIERELLLRKITFRKDDNAFLAVADPTALQAAADRFSADIIRKRLDYWTWLVGPNSSKADR